jgi:hypothetical protein
MADVVFTTLDAGGNVPPLLGIATEVARRGHHVRVLGHEQQRATFERAGLEFHPFTHPESWDPTEAQSTFTGLSALIRQFTGRQHGADLAALLTPDSIAVVDCMMPAFPPSPSSTASTRTSTGRGGAGRSASSRD